MPKTYIGFERALKETLSHIHANEPVSQPLSECEGHFTARPITSQVNSPSADTSLKDGYALRAADGAKACGDNPQPLTVTGLAAAGQSGCGKLKEGTAIRILTGARLPEGANTVVAEEFTHRSDNALILTEFTAKGRNILARGSDTAMGDRLLETGCRLTPGRIGLLAAAGLHRIRVYRKPAVALMATGDEVVLPGERLEHGKLFASNLLTLNSWCRHLAYDTVMELSGDCAPTLRQKIGKLVETQDALVTSGGAWTGDKDLITGVLDDLGWKRIYHRVRLGPGKAAGFGILREKPVFVLPGGPPSNLVAFLQLALPGLQKLGGCKTPGLAHSPAILKTALSGQPEWTQAHFGSLERGAAELLFVPHGRSSSRLKSMAQADAMLLLPEGVSGFSAGKTVDVQILSGFP